MNIQKLMGITAGTLLVVTNITPVFANNAETMEPTSVMDLCKDEITDSANIINEYIDGINIEKETNNTVPTVYNEMTYAYVQQPSYVYETQDVSTEQEMTVDEFLAMYGQMDQQAVVDTTAEETAYQQALENYNLAAAAYANASQLVEITKEVEVEVTEQITDEEGNVSEVVHTEIQTVTENVPAGDIATAQSNLDSATNELNAAQQNLETARNSALSQESIPLTPEVSGEDVIHQEVIVNEEVTQATSGTCGDNLTWTLDDNGLLTISGSGAMDDKYRTAWQDSVKSIELKEGITRIGDWAFYQCANITDVVIPNGVTSIGQASFYKCTGLKSVTLPDTVKTLGEYSFSWCDSLKDVNYLGSEKTFNANDLYHFQRGTTIHYLGKPFPFTDVSKDSWYYSTVQECNETGLIYGTSSTTFSPMQTMTRAMVVTILWRMEGQPKTTFVDKFKDVSSKQWFANSISWAVDKGVVHGYGDGTFKPDAAVTREQVAVMLTNFIQYRNLYKPGTKKLNKYPDGSQVSTYAQAGMKWVLTNGVMNGNTAGYLNPKKSATRAEGAAMLLRMNQWLNDNDPKIVAANKGIVGFVEWLVEKGYATGSQDKSVIADLNNNLKKYNLFATSKSSPFSLDNAVKSIDFIQTSNDLRALPEHGLNALKITNYLMLVAAIQNCASWDLYEEGTWGHSKLYTVGENIAVNSDDPFNSWYTKEKETYDTGGSGVTGHYLNIVNPEYVTTGYAWGYKKHSNQVFLRDDNNSTTFTTDQYLNLLKQYRNEMGI